MRHKSGASTVGWLVILMACTAVLLGTGFGFQAPASVGTDVPAVPGTHSGIAGWTAVGSYDESTLTADEGVATVFEPRHRTHELYRGFQSIPSNLKAQGWAGGSQGFGQPDDRISGHSNRW
jgi:hypothetical protein